ncbi:hypothetical protein H633G_11540 [Metarhizium anisopliae BRIP 53284]|nr:hypothetical protein H633G_11540 [Metarhizium anisopliae BRIP 53284]
MNPRSLKAHVDRAIEQSGNEHIENIKTVSTNQLKSGDLSIKTASAGDMEALRQFAEDWEHRLGNGATVRIPTYGVLVHGIRTNSMDVSRFEDIRDDILQENRPFIPNAGIKYIGWLTRTSAAKTASSVIIEFTRPQDANKIIDEGLIWQGEKCANCRGAHEAWSKQCATRKDEMAKVKAAYATRPRYHLVPQGNATINQTNPIAFNTIDKEEAGRRQREVKREPFLEATWLP